MSSTDSVFEDAFDIARALLRENGETDHPLGVKSEARAERLSGVEHSDLFIEHYRAATGRFVGLMRALDGEGLPFPCLDMGTHPGPIPIDLLRTLDPATLPGVVIRPRRTLLRALVEHAGRLLRDRVRHVPTFEAKDSFTHRLGRAIVTTSRLQPH